MINKGIVLAGGSGSRLYPATLVVNKQLMPLYDKPMVYYPISVLMLAGIRNILVITTPRDLDSYRRLLGTGEQLGVSFHYQVQEAPRGLAEAFILGRDFIGDDGVALILGDNIFYGMGLPDMLMSARKRAAGATVFSYVVKDPTRYGVVELDAHGRAVGLEEKPAKPRSRHAVTGLYFYDNRVVDVAAGLAPSARGELEITDVNRVYLGWGELRVEPLGRGLAWFDTGTADAFIDAANYIATIERRQSLKIGCLEEAAWRRGWVDDAALGALAAGMPKGPYRDYLDSLLEFGG